MSADNARAVDSARSLLEDRKAILKGHFRLTSGNHSDTYVQCAKVFEDPEATGELAAQVAARFENQLIDVVVSPAVGALVWGYEVARHLGVRFIFAERQAGEMVFRREFSVSEGERALVVEDVLTTGGSASEVIKLVRQGGGEVEGVASLIDRGGACRLDVPVFSLVQVNVPVYLPDNCPMCAQGIPLYTPGSRGL